MGVRLKRLGELLDVVECEEQDDLPELPIPKPRTKARTLF